MPIRVLSWIDTDRFAGTERHLLDLMRGLRMEGELQIEARLGCPPDSPLWQHAQEVNLPLLAIQRQGMLDLKLVRQLRRLLKSGRVHILHAHNGRTALHSALAVALARRGKVVFTQHFLEPDHVSRRGPLGIVFKAAHHWVGRRVAGFVAISQAVRHAMLERHEAPDDKITVVPNGITPPDAEHLTSRQEMRQTLNIAPDAPLVVCVARLEVEKDVGTLIGAMQAVTRQLPDALCLIAGEGAQHDALKGQIESCELQESVRLLGFVEDALSLIGASDVLALPSLAEPFGLVLLEAMALGVPVVATRAGAPPEIVEDGETGLLVLPAKPSALSEALLQLLHDPETTRKMGEAGRARFESEFTAARMARDIIKVYRKANDA